MKKIIGKFAYIIVALFACSGWGIVAVSWYSLIPSAGTGELALVGILATLSAFATAES